MMPAGVSGKCSRTSSDSCASDTVPLPNELTRTLTGSLTTPPYTEDVTWFVLKTPKRMSQRQADAFARIYPRDARPTQPLNGREVLASKYVIRAPGVGTTVQTQFLWPGELVGMDCFYVGRLSGTKGTVWQYTAIDVHSGFCWAELATSDRNPRQEHASRLARRVAAQLAAHGWDLTAITTDNGSEFRNAEFTATVTSLGAAHPLIRAGRPTSNGAVERVHRTILEECWRPSFARSLVPKLTALKRDLESYLTTTTTIEPTTVATPTARRRPR